MRPPTKLQVFANFLPPKMLQPFITPVLSRFISARLFSVPRVENEVKGLHFADVAEIQEAVTDELKKIQKEEFSAVFTDCTTAQKPVCMQMELILNKKVMCLPHVSSIFKKIILKFWNALCIYESM
jgi:hypothetical protein